MGSTDQPPGLDGIGGISRTAGPRKGAEEKKADAKDEPKVTAAENTSSDEALLAALTAKQLPDKDTKGSIEGLLYFSMESSKIKKSKDLSLLYKGSGGRLTWILNSGAHHATVFPSRHKRSRS